MGSTRGKPTPPEGLPDELVAELSDASAEELRKTIVHAQELLNFRDESPSPVEPQPGDDIIRITEREGHTEVVKRIYCGEDDCDACPHGPYLYHVTQERHPDGTETPYWRFLGKVRLEDE